MRPADAEALFGQNLTSELIGGSAAIAIVFARESTRSTREVDTLYPFSPKYTFEDPSNNSLLAAPA